MPESTEPAKLNYPTRQALGRASRRSEEAYGLAISAVVMSILPPVGVLLGVIAICLGVRARNRAIRENLRGRKTAIAAIWIGWSGILISLLIGIGFVVFELRRT